MGRTHLSRSIRISVSNALLRFIHFIPPLFAAPEEELEMRWDEFGLDLI